jgi:hypothetical protein
MDETTRERARLDAQSRFPIKVAAIAVFLLACGIGFSIAGLTLLFKRGWFEALPYLIVGGVTLLPGAYQCTLLALACRRVPGYSYELVVGAAD